MFGNVWARRILLVAAVVATAVGAAQVAQGIGKKPRPSPPNAQPGMSRVDAGKVGQARRAPAATPLVTSALRTYGDTINLNASNNGILCEAIDLPASRAVHLDSVVVSATGAGAPRAWVQLWGEVTPPNGGNGVALELDIPLHSANNQFYAWDGNLDNGFPVIGGSEFDGNGRPSNSSACMKAQASGSSAVRFMFSGTYLDADPVAGDDSASTGVNTPATIGVLTNDTDADGDSLKVASVSQGTHGSVTTNGTTVTYTPNSGFTGTDTFTYTATDGYGGTGAATVTMTVGGPTPVADARVDARAVNGRVSVTWQTASAVAVLGYDVWRFHAGAAARVNTKRVAAHGGGVRSATYTVIDRQAPRGVSVYWLQAIALDGTRSWAGSRSVRVKR